MAYTIKNDVLVTKNLTADRLIATTANSMPIWVTATAYLVGDVITTSNKIYKCTVAHTASVLFTTDAANWTELSPSTSTIQTLTDGASITWDGALGKNAVLSLSTVGATLQPITNPINGEVYTLTVNASAGRLLSFNGAYRQSNGGAISLSSGVFVNGTVSLSFSYDSTSTSFYLLNTEAPIDDVSYSVSNAGTVTIGASSSGTPVSTISTLPTAATATATIGTPSSNFFAGITGRGKYMSLRLKGSTVATTYSFSSFWKQEDGVTTMSPITVGAGLFKTVVFTLFPSGAREVKIVPTNTNTVVEDTATLAATTGTDQQIVFVQNTTGREPQSFMFDANRAFGDVIPTANQVKTVTFNSVTDIITTSVAHTLTAGTKVHFSNTAPAAPLQPNTDYFVINPTSTTFQVEASLGGGVVNLTSSGSFINTHQVSTLGAWLSIRSKTPATVYGFNTYKTFSINTTTVFNAGDYINILAPAELRQVTTGGTGFASITTQSVFQRKQGLELPTAAQFSDSFIPDSVLYGTQYYVLINASTSNPLVVGAYLANGGGTLPSIGEKVSFIFFSSEATARPVQWDTSWKDSTGTAMANTIVPANGQVVVDFIGTYTSGLPEFRKYSTGVATSVVENFAALPASPADKNTALVQNENGRAYNLVYDSAAFVGLASSTGGGFPSFTTVSVTSPDSFRKVAHGLAANEPVQLYPNPLTASVLGFTNFTTYYALIVDADNFMLSATPGGIAIPHNSGGAVTIGIAKQGWWVPAGGSTFTSNEIQNANRYLNQNNYNTFVDNATFISYKNAAATLNTDIGPGSIFVNDLSVNKYVGISPAGIGIQKVDGTFSLQLAEGGNATSDPWIKAARTALGTVNFALYSFNGTPEANVAADKGSFCVDYTNARLYKKTTNTVNTGWVESGVIQPWAATAAYLAGDIVYFQGRLLRAPVARTSNATFNGAESLLWTVLTALPINQWVAATRYFIGEQVTNNGILYKLISNGVSGATFNSAEEALWNRVGEEANVKTITSATYTVTSTDGLLILDPTSNSINVTFPSSIAQGKKITYTYKQHATNTITITAGSGTTIVDPSSFTEVSSYVCPGTTGQIGSTSIFLAGTIFRFLG